MRRAGHADLARRRDEIHAASFSPQSDDARRIGAEVELLVLDATARTPVPLDGPGGSIARLRRYASTAGWREWQAYDATTRFDIPGVGTISFEPGGQLELSSTVCGSPAALVTSLRNVVLPLRDWLSREGIALASIGIDPRNDAADVPLQLRVDRYEKMTRHFERIGPFGVRMMRQTAAVQVSVDRGREPAARWRLLNDLAAYVTAIFANSPVHHGQATGHQSYRAHCWRQLDPSRTGVAEPSDDPALAYARFAAGATDILDAGWDAHLTTLFPEVRPRGHYELRSCDAIDPLWYAAPIVFIAGITYDSIAAREAAVLAAESRALLRLAGEQGLRDASIARTSRDLFQLALDGARRLGSSYVDGESLDTAVEFYSRFTSRDRSPADDVANTERIFTVRSRSSRV